MNLEDKTLKSHLKKGSELFLTRNLLGFFDKCALAINEQIQFKCNQAVFDKSFEKKGSFSSSIWKKQPDLTVFKDDFPIIFEEDKADWNPADDFDRCAELGSRALQFFSQVILVLANGLHFSAYLLRDDRTLCQTHVVNFERNAEEWLPELYSFLLLVQDVLSNTELKKQASGSSTQENPDKKDNSQNENQNPRSKDQQKSHSRNPSSKDSKDKKSSQGSTVPNDLMETLRDATPMRVFACNAQVYGGFYQNQPAVAKIAQRQLKVGNKPMEVHVLQLLQNLDGIPQLFDWKILSEQRYLVVEERVSGCWKVDSWHEFASVFRQALSVLSQIHARNIVHGDLKPDNLFFNSNQNQVFFIDFDSASILSDGFLSETWMGTQGYRAPELEVGKNHSCSFAIDVWSLGVSFTELAQPLVGKNTKGADLKFWNQKSDKSGKLPENWECFATIVRRMLDENPNTRITAAEAMGLLQQVV
jgi:hypothetical protein